MSQRLDAQLAFLTEACRLKQVDRHTRLHDQSRPENFAEHIWHVALYGLIMLPRGADPGLTDRAIAMILLHDLAEIEAVDPSVHENRDADNGIGTEPAASDRIFGFLPSDQAQRLHALRDEFEAGDSEAARLAGQMDQVQTIFQAASPKTGHGEQFAIMQDTAGLSASDLSGRIAFLNEADALKSVYRATRIAGGNRFENSAEHSWHLALYALVLAEHAEKGVDIARVIRMLLIHDLVEIDAGDAPIFGSHDVATKEAEELAAARRIFGLLPQDQAEELLALWLEFETNETADARFAKALDRFQPPNQNLASGGGSWIDYDVDFEMISTRVGAKIANGAPVLWDWIAPKIKDFLDQTR
ncbi:HD domain-containing protein [Thalassovita sp.]|uniref:HD domain-containing protein n=1 Tax=Thalassovita sp. TaxID=1979401 RepID=UPI002B26D464|nr:HD domain-containing protein [Thalassovita sp.]